MAEGVQVTEPSTWDWIYKSHVDYVDEWFLVSSPFKPALVVAVYLLFVLKIGPAYMKDRPAYNLRNVLHVYNAVQVMYSFFLLVIITSGGFWYSMGKLMELLDTVFFVLRKKWNQISFLHVYHHSMVFIASCYILKYAPSATYLFTVNLNSFVHIIMYTYYGLAAFPGLRKYLWWKKYITKLQLVQFFMAFVNITVNFFTSRCPQSYLIFIWGWVHLVLFAYLFTKFYIESYRKNAENGTAKDDIKLQKDVKIKNLEKWRTGGN